MSGEVIKKIKYPIDKDRWIIFTLKRMGRSYQFSVNNSQVYQWDSNNIPEIDGIALATGIGVHDQNGTHVCFDDVQVAY